MTASFETKLSSPDGSIDGIVYKMNNNGAAWEFKSIDGTVYLTIARDSDGNWMRTGGTEPYLSSWTEELVKKVVNHS